MNSDQLSKEIVKIEREIAELKREYKNLLARSQVMNLRVIDG
jgi:DnaJ-domain-containing protein 1